MTTLSRIIEEVNRFVWGPLMITALFGTHIFMTFKTKFVQRKIFKAIRLTFTKEKNPSGDISPFSSLMTALASTIGTGNIIGVGTAVALGGVGAVFWCWITGIFGIATKYAESLAALKYRVKSKDGRTLGGAMYVLERGLRMKSAGVLFALFTIFASFGIGSGVQINAISNIFTKTFDPENRLFIRCFGFELSLTAAAVGAVCAVITTAVIFGGLKSISKVCSFLVPAMAALYILSCAVILIMNRGYILKSLALIISSAFSEKAASGGFFGSSVMLATRYGISRGLFSNEAGMGSSPIVTSAAKCRSPEKQALIASTATFWDTVVVCMLTGLTLVSSMLRNPESFIGAGGGDMTYTAFRALPFFGAPVLTLGIAAFAFSTVLGWSYYGESCAEYLFGTKARPVYRLLFIASVFFGAVSPLDVLWSLSDIFNALMALPNLTAVILLSLSRSSFAPLD